MIIRTIFGAVLTLATLHGEGSAQDEPRMVDLNVVAVDNHGAPVHDLTRDELRLTDPGRPETIAFFRLRDSKRGPVRPLGPNEFSNRSANNIPRGCCCRSTMS